MNVFQMNSSNYVQWYRNIHKLYGTCVCNIYIYENTNELTYSTPVYLRVIIHSNWFYQHFAD